MRADALHRHILGTLRASEVAEPEADAAVLFEHLTGMDLTARLKHGDRELGAGIAGKADALLARRLGGEPVHRLTGVRHFRGLAFRVTPDVLDPRPDTEVLIEAVLDQFASKTGGGFKPRIADLGTGSGAIGVSLAAALPQSHVTATDISRAALEVAAANAEANGLADRMSFVESDWFSAMEGPFDAIVSNPPYIETAAIHGLDREVRDHDPLLALDGGADGLNPYRIIARDAGRFLTDGGFVAVEHGMGQRGTIAEIFDTAGFAVHDFRNDLGGRDRVLVLRRSRDF